MRHRCGINLLAGDDNMLDPVSLPGVGVCVNSWHNSLAWQDIPDWYAVGARCYQCKRAGRLDRWDLAPKYGKKRMIITLEPLLGYTHCGKKKANDFVWPSFIAITEGCNLAQLRHTR